MCLSLFGWKENKQTTQSAHCAMVIMVNDEDDDSDDEPGHHHLAAKESVGEEEGRSKMSPTRTLPFLSVSPEAVKSNVAILFKLVQCKISGL